LKTEKEMTYAESNRRDPDAMTRIELDVSNADIAAGTPGTRAWCAIAHAARRRFLEHRVEVSPDEGFIWVGLDRYELDAETCRLGELFDEGQDIEPFTAILEPMP
jgi:hypothetical protein